MKLRVLLLSSIMALSALAAPVKSRLASFETEMISSPVLPIGMIAIEYIESTGSQYVNTGIIPLRYTSINVVLSASKKYSTFENCFCGASDELYSVPHYDLNARNGNITIWNGNSFFDTGVPFDVDTIYDIDIDASTATLRVTINGEIITTNRRTSFYSNYPFFLFTLGNQGESVKKRTVEMRLFRFSMTCNELHVLDLLPVRFINEDRQWEGALFDLVSGELFRNQGTGSFIIGPDL